MHCFAKWTIQIHADQRLQGLDQLNHQLESPILTLKAQCEPDVNWILPVMRTETGILSTRVKRKSMFRCLQLAEVEADTAKHY
jgi:hypothetical protein